MVCLGVGKVLAEKGSGMRSSRDRADRDKIRGGNGVLMCLYDFW